MDNITDATLPARDLTLQEQKLFVDSRITALVESLDPKSTSPKSIWERQYKLGLAWVHFPVGLGGLGFSPALIDYVSSSLRELNVPSNFLQNPIGIGMGAPTLISYSPDKLAPQMLRPMFTCDEIWCQLFSEPGAGSDVAAISTKAVRDGDEWIVNGQKVWTTLAHVAKWGMLLARTDPTLPKHSGMTYFIIDMESPGVDVRPLRQITGEAEFNEVYFDEVRIADHFRLGEVNNGWRVAVTTLMNERTSLGGTTGERGSGPIRDAIDTWNNIESHLPSLRDRLVQLWIEAEVNRLTNIRASQLRQLGNPGPEGSVTKLASAELNKKIYDFCESLLGAQGLLYSSYEMKRPEFVGLSTNNGPTDIAKAFLRSRANSIEGGTSEIMKNILAERVLGLPGEPRLDKDKPFNQQQRPRD